MLLAATDTSCVYRLLVLMMLSVTVARFVYVALSVALNIKIAEILGGPVLEVCHF